MTFAFGLLRKPSFRPSYLSAFSGHPNAHNKSILKCEAMRVMLCCSQPSLYISCMSEVIGFLCDRGYPKLCIPPYSVEKRNAILAKHKEKTQAKARVVSFAGCSEQQPFEHSHKILFVLPYSAQAKTLKIAACFRRHFSDLVPIDLVLAWTVKPNASRLLYRLNWPS